MSETSSTVGYGQQFPQDSDDEVNKIAFVVRQMMAQLVTTKLVKVVAVHGGAGAIQAAGTVDVLPLVNQIDGAGNATKHGTVYGIPWSRTQGGSSAIIVDPVVDDIGWVSCCDRDISSVVSSKAQANPGSFRKHDIADGIYVGGCLNATPDQFLVFTSTGCRLVDKNGNSVVMSSTGISVTDKTGNVMNMSSTGISVTPKTGLPFTVNGNLVVTGDQTVDGNQVVDGNLSVVGNIGAVNTTLTGTLVSAHGTIAGTQLTASDIIFASGHVQYSTHIHSGVQNGSGFTGNPD